MFTAEIWSALGFQDAIKFWFSSYVPGWFCSPFFVQVTFSSSSFNIFYIFIYYNPVYIHCARVEDRVTCGVCPHVGSSDRAQGLQGMYLYVVSHPSGPNNLNAQSLHDLTQPYDLIFCFICVSFVS